MIDLENDLKVFSLGRQQDFKTIAKVLISLNISLEEFVQYVEQKIDTVVKARLPKKLIIDCPACKAKMVVMPVNTGPGDQVDSKYNSVWICTNRNCMETIYNTQTIQEIVQEY